MGYTMIKPEFDDPSAARLARDEENTLELHLPPLPFRSGAVSPMEPHFAQRHWHPMAVVGVVENGLVRPLDPAAELPERSRVIIVATETPG
jgi:hypothetical protein